MVQGEVSEVCAYILMVATMSFIYLNLNRERTSPRSIWISSL